MASSTTAPQSTTSSQQGVVVMDKAYFNKEIKTLARNIRNNEDETGGEEWQGLKVSLLSMLEKIGKYCPDFELVLASLELAIEMNDNEEEQVRSILRFRTYSLCLSNALFVSCLFFNRRIVQSIVKSLNQLSPSVVVISSLV